MVSILMVFCVFMRLAMTIERDKAIIIIFDVKNRTEFIVIQMVVIT